MAAITWQNINGPSVAQAAVPLGDAQKTFAGMFSGLEDILKKREAIDTANYAQGKTNNTEAFLNEVNKYRTAEEFKAAQDAGVLSQMRQGFGAQIDAAAVRAAEDARLSTLQQRGLAGIQYNDAVIANKEKPIRDQYLTAVQQQDPLTQNIILNDPTLTNRASLVEAAQKFNQQKVLENRAAITFGNQQTNQKSLEALQPGLVDLQKAELAAKEDALLTAKVNREKLRAEANAIGNREGSGVDGALLKILKGQQDAFEKDFKTNNIFGQGSLNPERNIEAVNKLIDDRFPKDPDRAAEFKKMLAKSPTMDLIAKDGTKIEKLGYPIPLIAEALGVTKDTSGWFSSNNHAENFMARLQERMQTPEIIEQAAAAHQIKANGLSTFGIAGEPPLKKK